MPARWLPVSTIEELVLAIMTLATAPEYWRPFRIHSTLPFSGLYYNLDYNLDLIDLILWDSFIVGQPIPFYLYWKWTLCDYKHREEADIELPPIGQYATGICFVDELHHDESEAMFQEIARECSLQVSRSNLPSIYFWLKFNSILSFFFSIYSLFFFILQPPLRSFVYPLLHWIPLTKV